MVARALWSPSRIKTALQCGRKLQANEEGWERAEHIRGIRGRAVHSAIEVWEASGRSVSALTAVVNAWIVILEEASLGTDPAELVSNLWHVESSISVEEQKVYDALADQYKNVRATKAYKEGTAHLDAARAQAAEQRAEVEGLLSGVEWPWETDKGVLVEGFDHSLETVRRGLGYLADLWPEPDIIGAEWHLESDLGNGYRVHGYIDRVEGSGGVVEVVDYKSSRYQDSVLDHWLQAAVYAVIAEDRLGFPPDRVRLAYMRGQDSDVFEVQPGWREALSRQVEAADRVLATKAFAPTFTGCGICSWRSICEAEFPLVPVHIQREEGEAA